jgi:hypothetical protein
MSAAIQGQVEKKLSGSTEWLLKPIVDFLRLSSYNLAIFLILFIQIINHTLKTEIEKNVMYFEQTGP